MEILYIILAVILILIAVVFFRTVLFVRAGGGQNQPFQTDLPAIKLDPSTPAEHLSAAIKIETISHEDPAQNVTANFTALHELLAKTYPRLHATLIREVLEGFSLLYTWQGKDASLDPVVFMAHQDVVPADEHTLDKWTHPPFSGRIADGFVWGRGTLDIKCQLIAVMEAVEHLLEQNFQPERTVLLSFSHDEEVLGHGALAIVKHLKEKGVRVHAVLDEGTSVLDGILPRLQGAYRADCRG